MTRVCVQCGAEFEQKPGVRPMRFCSLTCSRRYESAQRAHDAEYKARKAARDRAYAATPEGRARLRAAERKYREKRRAARLASLQERLASSPIHCQRCGAPLDPQRPGRKVYCAECGREVNREKTRENMARRYEVRKVVREARTCAICGKAFTPARRNQTYCGRQCACLGHRKQSREWMARLNRERKAQREAHACAWCGKEFQPQHGRQVYCSQACYREASRKRDLDRRAPKAIGGGLTNRQIAKVQADVRLPPSDRYAASKEWTPAMHAYARKLYEQHNSLFSAYRPSTGFNN